MDANSQASLLTEVPDEELDRYLEQGHACSSSHAPPSISSSTSLASIQTTVNTSAKSVQSSEKEQVTCDLCQKQFTKRGLNKHRNACLKKRQI